LRLVAGSGLLLALTGCTEAPATVQAQKVHTLYNVIFALALPVFVVVEALLIWFVIRGRRAPTGGEPPQSFGSRRALLIFFLIPTVIVAVDYGFGERTLAQVDKQDPNPSVTIRVEGFQWEWTFFYVNEGTFNTGVTLKKDAVMEIPVDQPIHIELESRDVIHSFFVPAFLFKRDVIPGRHNNFTFTADKLGTFPGQCAEFCGLYHNKMRFVVKVVDEPTYEAWIKQQRQAALNVTCPSRGNTVSISAKDITWSTACISVKAGSPIGLTVSNQDAGINHNFAIYKGGPQGQELFMTGKFPGVTTRTDTIPQLPPDHYYFQCDVHGPAMSGVYIVNP